MKPAAFRYHRPKTVTEAVALLHSCGEHARPVAGGQSLAPMMNMRLAQPSDLIDLRDIGELAGIQESDSNLEIGAMTTHHAIATSPLVARLCPMLTQAAATIAHYAIRKQGTLGGSLAHADPAAQLPLVALALDAQLRIVGTTGQRSTPARAFFQGLMTTELGPTDLLVAARFVPVAAGHGQSFCLFNLRHGDFAIVAVAAETGVQGGALTRLRLALGGVAPTPVALDGVAHDLLGQSANAALARTIAQRARAALVPFDSPGISALYRSELIEVLVEKAMIEAIERARQSRPAGL